MRKRFLWAALVGLIAVTVTGASTAVTGKSDARAQVLRVAIGAEPPSLDPGLATDTTSANLLFNLMDPLIRLGAPRRPGRSRVPTSR
jgi:ABC-type oligopeptide transport system substrate-binding subunit